MERVEITAEHRSVVGKKVKLLRRRGIIPAVLYGRDVDGAAPIQGDAKTTGRALTAGGVNQLISLKVGEEKPSMAVMRQIQRDPVYHNVLHLDFYKVVMSEKIDLEIHIELVGEAPAVKNLGCTVIQSLDSLNVQCLPSDMVSSIEVDVSSLSEYNDLILVSDIELPDGFTLLADMDTVIARAEPPRTIEELEALEEPVEAVAGEETERIGRVAEEGEVEGEEVEE